MVCSACGSSMNEGAKFCSNCGHVVAAQTYQQPYATDNRRLMRSRTDRKIAGVCGGIAEYTGWDATMIRLVAVIAAVCGVGTPVLAYVIAWIVMPEAPFVMPVYPPQGPVAGTQYPGGQYPGSQGPGAAAQ